MDMKDQMKTEKEQNGQATKKGMTLENVRLKSYPPPPFIHSADPAGYERAYEDLPM
ncbi:hypothetical protein [Paenibacillus polymyxa]|uniref:hypothetical protein n=1 Tax=Paenibacillus polymyxa TaxID=1406 RepID=UPI0014850B00|nr:hypothetical protein [Paenibacillus polymyxa]